MPNIWRRQPSGRLSSCNLVKKEVTSTSVAIANEFFETEVIGYPYHRYTLKTSHSGRRGFDETTGRRRGYWPKE